MQTTALAGGLLVALVGAAHLAAWLRGSPAPGVGATTIIMRAGTSLDLLLAGLALALLSRGSPPAPLRLAARVLAGTVVVSGALTLAEHVWSIDLGLVATGSGRIGLPAAASFVLLGIALLLLSRRSPNARFRAVHQVLAVITLVAALVPLVGYLYGADELYGIAQYTRIAWSTAASLLVLAVGVLLARPREGLMAVVTADDPGGALVRRLLGPMVLIPLGLGWLRLAGERSNWFDPGAGTSLTMLVVIVAFSALVVLGGHWVSRSEAALARQEEDARRRLAEIQAIYDSAHVGLCVFDRDLRFLRINRRLAEINGVPAADHIGKTVEDIVPALAPVARALAERIVRTGEGVTGVEFRGTTSAQPGVERTWAEQWLPLKDAAGRVVAINVVVEDITERKRTEEVLRQSQSRLAAALAIAELGVWEYDVATARTRHDERCRNVFGVPDDRLLSNEDVLALVHPDDRSRVALEVQAALDPRGGGLFETEYRIVRPDGTERWVAVRGHAIPPVDDAKGAAPRFVGTLMDITDRHRADQALRAANARLEEADRRKDEFIAIMSHELRNPLAPIRYALPLLEREDLRDDAARAVAVIDRQVDQLTRLVNDLLDVARITHGTIALRRETVTLGSVLRAATEAATPAIVDGGHSLTTQVPDEPIWVEVDHARIAQAVTNLLINSAKYTPRGGQIVLAAECREGMAVIRVRDTGIGIEPEVLPLLFEMFRQVGRADRPQGGLGVGLAFARRLVEMHGGTIEAHSRGRGQGSEFVIRLAAVTRAGDGAARLAPGREGSAGRRLKVLVVDDNPDLVQVLSLVLEGAGHDVRTASDGESAIARALSYRPDVVLLDIEMPAMGGLEVARALRQHPELSSVRLVALTGWEESQHHQRTREAGFDHHLTKPTEPGTLEELLARIAAERREGFGET
jgi:PAS domain S-box-containing protein